MVVNVDVGVNECQRVLIVYGVKLLRILNKPLTKSKTKKKGGEGSREGEREKGHS